MKTATEVIDGLKVGHSDAWILGFDAALEAMYRDPNLLARYEQEQRAVTLEREPRRPTDHYHHDEWRNHD